LFSPHTLLSATLQKKDRLGVALVGLGYYSTDLLAPALQQTKNAILLVLLPRHLPSRGMEKKYISLTKILITRTDQIAVYTQ
jgi:hypothetical protein